MCRCNAVSRGTIAAAIRAGAATAEQVADATRASTGCGSCSGDVCRLLAALGPPAAEPARSPDRVSAA